MSENKRGPRSEVEQWELYEENHPLSGFKRGVKGGHSLVEFPDSVEAFREDFLSLVLGQEVALPGPQTTGISQSNS